jgi:hypothetical protein
MNGNGGWNRSYENRTTGFGRKTEPGENLSKPNWDLTKLRPFTKNLYKPQPVVENR